MIGERKYWPAEWVDDPLPPGRASPDDFIIDAGGHYFLGYRLDAPDVSEFQKRLFNTGIDPQDVVEFMSVDDLGSIDVTMLPDGECNRADDIPAQANGFWLSGPGAQIFPSLEALAAAWFEANDRPAKGKSVTVWLARWSKGIPHQFMPPVEGKVGASFVSLKPEGETVQ